MKSLKYIAIIVVAIVALAIVLRFRNCSGGNGSTVTIPDDSTFAPTEHRSYSPSVPIPFLTRGGSGLSPTGRPPARLPRGVSERDVNRVVSLKYKNRKEPVNVIEMKDGMVYVEKDSLLESVTDWKYEPAWISVGLFLGIGVTVSLSYQERVGVRFSPMAKLSFIELAGIVRLPVVAADLNGLGLGAEVQLYHDIYAGAVLLWRYDDTSRKMVKATLQFNL